MLITPGYTATYYPHFCQRGHSSWRVMKELNPQPFGLAQFSRLVSRHWLPPPVSREIYGLPHPTLAVNLPRLKGGDYRIRTCGGCPRHFSKVLHSTGLCQVPIETRCMRQESNLLHRVGTRDGT